VDHRPLAVAFLWCTMAAAAYAGGLRGEVQLDKSISPSGLTNSDSTAIDAEGNNVFVAWTETAVSPATTNEIYFARSTDGGRSWSSPLLLSSSTDGIDDAEADVSSDGNSVVVVWLHGSALLTQDVQGIVSNDGGATFGSIQDLSGYLKGDAGDADTLSVHMSGQYIYVCFEDDVSAPGGNEDVYVVASTDGGATFAAPVRINDPAAGSADVDDPELKCSGANAYVVWVDKRTGNDRIYFDRTLDGGVTWGTDVRLDRESATADSDNPSMSIEGTNIHVVWTDDRNDVGLADQVFYVVSNDSGATFSLDKKLGSAAVGVDADDAKVSASGSNVYVVWADNRNGAPNDIFFISSSDNGVTFGSDFALDSDAGTIEDQAPHIRSKGDAVFVLYREEINLLDQVYLAWSPNHGAQGSFQTLHLSATLGSAFDADNDTFTVTRDRDVVTAWVDNRAGGVNNDVYVNGQRLPNLDAVPHGNKLAFQLSDATPSDDNQLFLCLFSQTGTDSFLLPGGMNFCLTIDGFTLLLLQPWAIPLVTDTVSGGAASTADLPLHAPGFAAALILDPVSGAVLASTDPISFN
jgi:hypothetical protein